MEYPSKSVCRALANLESDLRFCWFEGGVDGPHFGVVRLEPTVKVGEIHGGRTYKTFFWECVDSVCLFDKNGHPDHTPGMHENKQPMVELHILGKDPGWVMNGHFVDFQWRTRKPQWAANMDLYEALREKGKKLDDKLEDAGRGAADKMWYRFRKEEQNLPITTKEEKLAAMKESGMDRYEDNGADKWADMMTSRAAPFKREAPRSPEL